MNKTPAHILASILIAVAIIFAWYLGKQVGQLPIDIYVAPSDDENLLQWRKDWTKAGTSVVTASVIGDSSDEIYVYVDLIYSGKHGYSATACGAVREMSGNRADWTCSPVGVKRGRTFIALRMQLSSKSEKTVCSNELGIRIYDESGDTFFAAWYPYQKVWVRDGKGFEGKLTELLTLC